MVRTARPLVAVASRARSPSSGAGACRVRRELQAARRRPSGSGTVIWLDTRQGPAGRARNGCWYRAHRHHQAQSGSQSTSRLTDDSGCRRPRSPMPVLAVVAALAPCAHRP